MLHSITWWSTFVSVLIATVWDLRSRRIPNWLVAPFLVAGISVSVITGGWAGFERSVLGILLGAGSLGLFYVLGGMGMGDVKLCAAIGAWVGPQQLLLALVFMGLAGGVMALGWAFVGGFWKESLDGAADLLLGFRRRGFRRHETLVLANAQTRKLPYAPAIAIGAMLSFLAFP